MRSWTGVKMRRGARKSWRVRWRLGRSVKSSGFERTFGVECLSLILIAKLLVHADLISHVLDPVDRTAFMKHIRLDLGHGGADLSVLCKGLGRIQHAIRPSVPSPLFILIVLVFHYWD
jgi:hypothetical protein